MHMADALVAPIVAGTMYLTSSVTASYSIKHIHLEDDVKKVPLMGIMGAFVFATQMINFTIPGTGSSGHLCGGMLLTAILGPYAAFLTMIGVLLIQCLFFADGGLLALGCNIWNMAFYGCFIGGFFIWKLIMKNGLSKTKIMLASLIGCIVTLQLGAFSVTLQTLASSITELPFVIFVSTMQPIHLAIGLVEGLITDAVLIFIYEARPELLWTENSSEKSAKLSFKAILVTLTIACVMIGGFISQFASSNPDGLEWSMERVAGTVELEATGLIHQISEGIQSVTAILPDYAFKGSDSMIGTSFSGIFGGFLVILFFVLIGSLFKFFKKRFRYEQY